MTYKRETQAITTDWAAKLQLEPVMQALRNLELRRPGTSAQLILYPSGDGALVWESWDETFRTALDFHEGADLLEMVNKLTEMPNQAED